MVAGKVRHGQYLGTAEGPVVFFNDFRAAKEEVSLEDYRKRCARGNRGEAYGENWPHSDPYCLSPVPLQLLRTAAVFLGNGLFTSSSSFRLNYRNQFSSS